MDKSLTVNDVRKMFSLPTQAETNYQPAGQQGNKACSSCRFYLRDGWDGAPSCHLIENWPEPIEPNGLCDRHEFAQPPQSMELEPVPVVIVEPAILAEDSSEMMSLSMSKSIRQRVLDFISGLTAKPAPEPTEQPAFKVFKTADGKMAWVARYTGKFIDRESEILADQAHDDYVQRVQSGSADMPELWMWHAEGTKHGQAVYVWKSGGFVCAAGYIDDTAPGRKAFAFYEKNSGKIKLSHMFYFDHADKVDGVYTKYHFTREITTLPDGAEAFPYTSFEEMKTMTIPQAGQDMIREALGQETLDAALAADGKALTDTKTLEASGVAFKSNAPAPAAPPAEDKAAPVAPAIPAPAPDDQLKALTGQVAILTATVKALLDRMDVEVQAKTDLLTQLNDLKAKMALYGDLQPPASQSSDTLLSGREKTIVETALNQAKMDGEPSYIEKLLGVQPTIQS